MKTIKFLIIFFASITILTYCYLLTQFYYQYISYHFYLTFIEVYPHIFTTILIISYIVAYSLVNIKILQHKKHFILSFISISIIFDMICYKCFSEVYQVYYAIFILGLIIYFVGKNKALLCFLYSILCFIIIAIYIGIEYNILDYIQIQKETKYNKFYENYYVNPKNAEIIEPKQKKNLILISLESMEFTFANLLDKNYIPELSKLAEDNISFTNYVNGYAMNITQTSMIATLCGIPSCYINHLATKKLAHHNQLLVSISKVCPNAYSFSQILKDHGYTLAQIQGTSNHFANAKTFLESHGFDTIEGFDELKSHPLIKHPFTSWGIKDSDLFNILKEKTTSLAKKQPFFLYCNTIDSHYTIVETKEMATDSFQEASKMTFDFVQWIQSQYFGENTVIIIIGDHARWGYLYRKIPNRTIYNAFINSQAIPKKQERTFWAMDLCPTILESLGFKLKNPRLGLGVSLFSSEPTLIESMGQEKLTKELQKNSQLYNSLWQ